MGISPATDREFMQLAMAQAQQAAAAGEVPVGAVVVLAGEVIAAAHNQVITLHDPTAHAEVLAMRQAGQRVGNYRLVDCTLYVTLEPCSMCVGACIHARIKRLVYGASDPKTGAVASVDQLLERDHHNHRVDAQGGVEATACGQMLTDFFAARRLQHKAQQRQDNE
ncbi:tRNA adenosine(34) deaminase TadA [Marinicella meishanensis]|uniref:tRNA adenosine(34) deaminase TadA n=1 Tax=Marinicella meishanensis TaxID=2873263 RepID=UPI001CBFDDAC|nr:tRNA adenosine(34) deaminase TadA [Marinicella sp. NBU2979]